MKNHIIWINVSCEKSHVEKTVQYSAYGMLMWSLCDFFKLILFLMNFLNHEVCAPQQTKIDNTVMNSASHNIRCTTKNNIKCMVP